MSRARQEQHHGRIRVGIGGWSYAPWRETFYPPEVPVTRALEYASRQVTAIEINSTFYGTQKASTFAKWYGQTPEGFVFSVKAPRVCTYRRSLEEAADSVARFTESGLDRLGEKLGPLLWQFPPSKAFVADEFGAFLTALPRDIGGRVLRHAVDIRHHSFASRQFLALARQQGVAIAVTDASEVPNLFDVTAEFIYLRLRNAKSRLKTGYSAADLKRWADAAELWRIGETPDEELIVEKPLPKRPRDVFLYFINGAKERAPAAAMRMIELLNA